MDVFFRIVDAERKLENISIPLVGGGSTTPLESTSALTVLSELGEKLASGEGAPAGERSRRRPCLQHGCTTYGANRKLRWNVPWFRDTCFEEGLDDKTELKLLWIRKG